MPRPSAWIPARSFVADNDSICRGVKAKCRRGPVVCRRDLAQRPAGDLPAAEGTSGWTTHAQSFKTFRRLELRHLIFRLSSE